jgi:uncharacterized DUF497 family protein
LDNEIEPVKPRKGLHVHPNSSATASHSSLQASVEAIDNEEDHILQNAGHLKKPNSILEGTNDEFDDELAVQEEMGEQELGDSTIHTLSDPKLTSMIHPSRLQKDWQSPIYAFFSPDVAISYVDGRRVHDFTCVTAHCKGKGKNSQLVRHYLDTDDKKSTSGLRRHAIICWGEEVVKEAAAATDIASARAMLKGAVQRNRSITAIFERLGKEKITYSYRQHTKAETQWVIQT